PQRDSIIAGMFLKADEAADAGSSFTDSAIADNHGFGAAVFGGCLSIADTTITGTVATEGDSEGARGATVWS
ncbi:MAG: hypothetical protein ACI9OJ_001896, partial [Myxococcota bacterium]